MDIRPTDLPLLVSLDTLLELKNVTRAAKRLNMSQPALSTQLARLRTLFDDPLLQPSETGRGMVATPRGLELIAPLREAIEHLNRLGRKDSTFNPATDSRTFRISGNTTIINSIGAQLVRHVHAHGNPGIRLEFQVSPAEDLLRRFEGAELDLLIGCESLMPAALRMRLLGRDEHVLVQRRHHPRGEGRLTLQDYCALRHLKLEALPSHDDVVDAHLESLGMRRHIAVSMPHFGMAREILTGTDVVATMPRSLLAACNDAQLQSFELPFNAPAVRLAMAWHRRSDTDQAHRWLRECMRSYGDTEVHAGGLGVRTKAKRGARPRPITATTTTAMRPRAPVDTLLNPMTQP